MLRHSMRTKQLRKKLQTSSHLQPIARQARSLLQTQKQHLINSLTMSQRLPLRTARLKKRLSQSLPLTLRLKELGKAKLQEQNSILLQEALPTRRVILLNGVQHRMQISMRFMLNIVTVRARTRRLLPLRAM